MLLVKCLDGIWSEPAANQWCKTRRLRQQRRRRRRRRRGAESPEEGRGNHSSSSDDDKDKETAQLPDTYLFVGVPDTYGSRKPAPPIPSCPQSINGGFWLASPSLALFDYYTSLLSIPGSFDGQYMEQGLFRHAHRKHGPMPWQQFKKEKWNVNWPRLEDLRRGTATLHDRFWITDEGWEEPELVRLWNEGMREMLVFYHRHEQHQEHHRGTVHHIYDSSSSSAAASASASFTLQGKSENKSAFLLETRRLPESISLKCAGT